MRKVLLGVTLLMSAPVSIFAQDSIDFEKVGIIREFGGADNAALFGVRSNSGTSNVIKVVGATSRTYVLSYDGAIDGNATRIEASINDLFKDLDGTKSSSEIMHQNYPQTNVYSIEAFVEPSSEQTVAYIEDFVRTHGEFTVGNVKIQPKPAAKLVDFFSIEGFGLDPAGKKEVSWGSFVMYRQFPSVSGYESNVQQLGITLSQGNEGEILKAIMPILNPVDARSFQEWFSGMGSAKHKLSRFHWESHSFFIMEDGSVIGRSITWHLDRSLILPE